MAFHEVQFPTDISYGSAGGPEFSTEVVELCSGHEVRNINWTNSRERWNVAYGVRAEAQLATLIEFFYARRGRAHGFRFKNPADYQGTAEAIGTGDGSETEFQLVKVYTSGAGTYSRKVSKPVADTVVVSLGGVPQVDSNGDPDGWSVDTTTGIVTFISPPSSGEVITATFDFDIPVRFDTDHLPQALVTYQARSADVPIVELML